MATMLPKIQYKTLTGCQKEESWLLIREASVALAHVI